MGLSLHNADDKNEDEDNEEEDEKNPPEDIQGKELGEDDLDYDHEVQIENGGLVPSSSLRHWTCSQRARQEEVSLLVEEILSDEDKSKKSQMEVKVPSKGKVPESTFNRGKLGPSASNKKANLPDQTDPEG